MRALALLLLVACTPHVTSAIGALSQLPLCSTAVPDDDLDDTAAVQAAIDARCCLGPGVHDIDMAPTPPTGRRRYNMLTVAATGELCGVGATTVLRFRGDAGGQDWRGVEHTGGAIHDLTLDTSALIGTSEQTHAVHALGPATGTVERVTFNHPIRGTLPGGDCVDLVGYPSQLVTGYTIRDNTFAHCDRGGVQVHSGAVGLAIDHNLFADTGDFDIDSEGSGSSSGWTITRNTFQSSEHNQGAFAIALDLVDDVTVAHNTLERGVYLYSCTHCAIVANVIEASSGHSQNAGTIDAIKGSNDLTIADNVVRRIAGSDTGPVIHIGPHGTAQSLDVRITHNQLEQQTAGDGVYVEGAAGVTIADNAIAYAGPTSTSVAAVRVLGSGGASGTATARVAVVHNTITGGFASSVYAAGANGRQGVGSLLATWNATDRPGLKCENMSGVLGPLVLSYNSWLAGSCGVPAVPVTLP